MGPSFGVEFGRRSQKTLEMSAPEDGDDEDVVRLVLLQDTGTEALTEHDHVLMNAFCPEAWQVTIC